MKKETIVALTQLNTAVARAIDCLAGEAFMGSPRPIAALKEASKGFAEALAKEVADEDLPKPATPPAAATGQ